MSKQEDVRKCSTETFKMIYYVIIGLAFTEALASFFRGGSPILLFALLPTICRFVHGASIHLEMDRNSKKRWKLPLDFGGFFFQASFFYLMSQSLLDLKKFSLYFGIVLFSDGLWLLVLKSIKYLEFERSEKQWLWSDFIFGPVFISLFIFNCSSASWAYIILILAIIATIWDYWYNNLVYFPLTDDSGARVPEEGIGLKI